MPINGYYYLHTNGDLIYKRADIYTIGDLKESSFVEGIWPIDLSSRANAWQILVEAGVAGARLERVRELVEKWKCDNDDARNYVSYLGIELDDEDSEWCASLDLNIVDNKSSPAGFGKTALEAITKLCRVLGYETSKYGGVTFEDLVKARRKK